MIGSEEFDFGIERFCKRIGGTVIVGTVVKCQVFSNKLIANVLNILYL